MGEEEDEDEAEDVKGLNDRSDDGEPGGTSVDRDNGAGGWVSTDEITSGEGM